MSILMWVLIAIASALSWMILLTLTGLIYYYFSKKVLERRYKVENDRSRPINSITKEVGGVTSYEQLLRNNFSAKRRGSLPEPNDNGNEQHDQSNQGFETQTQTTPTTPNFKPLPTFSPSPSGLNFLEEDEG